MRRKGIETMRKRITVPCMYYTEQLARPRSVRLTKRAESLLMVEAARIGKTINELIREKVEGALTEQQMAGDAVLAAAKDTRRRVPSQSRLELQAAYLERHKQ